MYQKFARVVPAIVSAATLGEARRDPFNEVVEYEDLVIARDLIKRGPVPEYWVKRPMPIRPIGEVRHEILRQIATFLIPLTTIVGGVYYAGWGTLWVTLPIGLLIGRKMDESLEADIARTQARDDSIDRGRYRAVQILSAHLGIPRDEIPLEMIIKMAKDCDCFEQKAKARQAQEAAEAQARRDLSRRQESTLVAKSG